MRAEAVEVRSGVASAWIASLWLPFLWLGRAFDAVGRLASLILGFVLMVTGTALTAGGVYWLGIPMFLFGLYLMAMALG